MIVTCPSCKIKYRLDSAALGAGGRKVRCTECLHQWIQAAEKLPDDISDVLAESDKTAHNPLNEERTIENEVMPESFEIALKEKAVAEEVIEKEDNIPNAVKPLTTDFTVPTLEEETINMSAIQIGVLGFLFCTFASLIFLFIFKSIILDISPPAAAVYKAFGFNIQAPGEGLHILELEARKTIKKSEKNLLVTAKVTNVTKEPRRQPAFEIRMENAYGAILKTWIIEDNMPEKLAPEETSTIEFNIKDPPEEGTEITIQAIKK